MPDTPELQNSTTPKKKKRGRPSQINRDKVLQTALNILKQSPDKEISMSMVAQELGIVTMGVYKHVNNKDDLLEGVAGLVFAELDLQIDGSLSKDKQFYKYCKELRDFFLANPFAIPLISWHEHMSRDLLNWSADLAVMLKGYGLRGKKLALMLEWLTRQLLAYITLESVEHTAPDLLNRQASFDGLSPEKQKLLKPLFIHMGETDNEALYEMHIRHTLAVIKQASSINRT